MKLGGVIYLQNIDESRMKGAARKNIDVFHKLCGDKALARVVLGTTKWGEVYENKGKDRERQLTEIYWKAMIDSGSKSLRFDGTKESAWAFLDSILDGQLKFDENREILSDSILRIQNELVDLNRNISETAAGKEIRYTLQQLLEMQSKEPNSERSANFERQLDELKISLPRKLYLKIFVSR